MLVLNQLMPLHRDDYEYALIWGTLDKITSWQDIVPSLYNHYMIHGGRMVDFFVLDSFLLLGKEWFNPFNALLFVMLIVLVYWYSLQTITFQFNPTILSLLIVFSWLGLPHFALTNIWMTGACVYLMPAVFILAFMLPYYFHFIDKPVASNHPIMSIGMFIGGIIASWTIENTVATMQIVLIVLIFYFYKKTRIEKWMLFGYIGSLVGFILLVVAPGNYVRYAAQNSKLIYHFTNQIVGNGEMLLYAFPILIFFVMLKRVLILEQAKGQSKYEVRETIGHVGFSAATFVSIGLLFLLITSYLSNGFFWKWLANGMYEHIAIPLGIATPKLKAQFFNTMSGVEEMLIYLLALGQVYRYAFKKLRLRKKENQKLFASVSYRHLWREYPAFRNTALFFALCVLNNLAMLASPTFPGRATYSSVLFLLIGVMNLFNIKTIYQYFLLNTRKYFVMAFAAILFLPMAGAVLYQYVNLDRENGQRMEYIKQQVSQGAVILEVEPLSIRNRVLRHVYFVELNNPVSKYGFCRYYGLKDIIVKEQ